MKHKFKNKIALITGGTQGIGEATARYFVSEGLTGLAICGRNKKKGSKIAKELNLLGCKTIFIKADLSRVSECFKIINKIDKVFSKIDILINCAAQTDRGTILSTSPKLWDSIFATNVKAPFFLMQGVAKIMIREKTKGVITSVLSIQSYGGSNFLTPYAASKGALKILTKNVASSLLKKQIRVNGLNLGWTDTPNERLIQKKYHKAKKEWFKQAGKTLPFKKLIQPIDVARVLSFMCSDESSIMSGSIIDFAEIVMGPIDGKGADKL
tara:strand:- start:691 stop:1494 length:804 start_codon:yes stop_codon:yes gene_type:complete